MPVLVYLVVVLVVASFGDIVYTNYKTGNILGTTADAISASPNPCTIASGQTVCSSTISWTLDSATTADVCVSPGGGADQLFALIGKGSGSKVAPWINTATYTFKLKTPAKTCGGTEVKSVSVTGKKASTPIPSPTPTAKASPSPSPTVKPSPTPTLRPSPSPSPTSSPTPPESPEPEDGGQGGGDEFFDTSGGDDFNYSYTDDYTYQQQEDYSGYDFSGYETITNQEPPLEFENPPEAPKEPEKVQEATTPSVPEQPKEAVVEKSCDIFGRSSFVVNPYIVYPADQEIYKDYERAVYTHLKTIESWYCDKVGSTFALNPVRVVRSSETYAQMRCGVNKSAQEVRDCLSTTAGLTGESGKAADRWYQGLMRTVYPLLKEDSVTLVFAPGGGSFAGGVRWKDKGDKNFAIVGDWVLEPISGRANDWGINCSQDKAGFCKSSTADGTIATVLGNSFGLKNAKRSPAKFPDMAFTTQETVYLEKLPIFMKSLAANKPSFSVNKQSFSANKPASQSFWGTLKGVFGK